MEYIEKLTSIVPSKRQLEWQKLEFTAFFHYGMNSFTNREWGDGSEDISIFNPKKMNTDQWCEGLVSAGIKACIITAKHHDGFCLWNTAYTTHSVMHTPFGEDIVAKLSKSCEKYGLKLGIYLSPWDRHEATYGSGKQYDDYFCNQLTELLSNYGKVYTVWFDGACGEGPNGKKQQYDWDRYYEVIRRLQPEAVISISGPDVRWCGNEAGDCRESEWSVVPARVFSQKAIAENSQTADDSQFREKKIDERTKDLGSREVLNGEDNLIWYPAEVDTSIRPGWFYHETEDDKVRSLDELTNIYLKSVGGNSVLLLNIPPHFDGYLAAPDMKRLSEIGEWLKKNFTHNLVENATISSDSSAKDSSPEKVRIDDETEWKTQKEKSDVSIKFSFDKKVSVNYVVIKEQISKSQRVEAFTVILRKRDGKTKQFNGTTIGYKKICKISESDVFEVEICFNSVRDSACIRNIAIF